MVGLCVLRALGSCEFVSRFAADGLDGILLYTLNNCIDEEIASRIDLLSCLLWVFRNMLDRYSSCSEGFGHLLESASPPVFVGEEFLVKKFHHYTAWFAVRRSVSRAEHLIGSYYCCRGLSLSHIVPLRVTA